MTNPELPESLSGAEKMAPLVLFAWKAAITGLVLFVTVALTFSVVALIVENAVGQIKIAGSAFWGNLERELEKAADPDRGLSPERRKKLLNDIRAAASQWRPFIVEAYSAATESTAGSPSANCGDREPSGGR